MTKPVDSAYSQIMRAAQARVLADVEAAVTAQVRSVVANAGIAPHVAIRASLLSTAELDELFRERD